MSFINVQGNIPTNLKYSETSSLSENSSLRLKSISTWNVWGIPWFSKDLSKRMKEWTGYIYDKMSEDQEVQDNDLIVSCVQEAWGYRVGILGYPINWIAYKNTCCETNVISSIANTFISGNKIQANDSEMLAGAWCIGTRAIPILNAGVWDPKRCMYKHIKKEKSTLDVPLKFSYVYGACPKNKSVSGMFNLRSIILQPILDSGCCIFSNKPAFKSGYERWNTWGSAGFEEDMANKGIVWAYYESSDFQQGISVMTLHIAGASPSGTDESQLSQIASLKVKLEQLFSSRVLQYDTYLAGDFNIEFTKRFGSSKIMKKWKILENAGFEIVSESSIGSTSKSGKEIDFVMHASEETSVLETSSSSGSNNIYETQPVEKTDLSDHWFVRVDVQ